VTVLSRRDVFDAIIVEFDKTGCWVVEAPEEGDHG